MKMCLTLERDDCTSYTSRMKRPSGIVTTIYFSRDADTAVSPVPAYRRQRQRSKVYALSPSAFRPRNGVLSSRLAMRCHVNECIENVYYFFHVTPRSVCLII